MPNYTLKQNQYGQTYEVRFIPTYYVEGTIYNQLGRQLMHYGRFLLGGWSWDDGTGELYRYDRQGIPFDPKTEVERIDALVCRLLEQFIRWREFEGVQRAIQEKERQAREARERKGGP